MCDPCLNKQGYTLIIGPDCPTAECLQCPNNCKTCNTGGNCVECFRPYYLKLGLCDQCTASNYYQNDNGECSDCLDDNCDKCRTSDGKCIKCLAGYAVRKSDLTCTSISDCVAAPVRSEKTHHHNEIINADWCVDTYFCDCSCFE